MGVGFFERSEGNKSMMRLIMFLGVCISGFVCIWSMYEIHRVISAVLTGKTEAVSMLGTLGIIVGGSLGVIVGGEGFKALQQRGESNESNRGGEVGRPKI